MENRIKNIIVKLIPLQIRVAIMDYKRWKSIKRNKRDCLNTQNRITNITRNLVYMADGTVLHGGLSDRLCGMVSLYQYCKLHKRDFKIYFTNPYLLCNYLEPNTIDWRISDENILTDTNCSKIVSVSLFSHHVWLARIYANILLKTRKNQIQAYSNMRYFYHDDFKLLFNDLFRPSEALQTEVNRNLENIGTKDYISLTFRFQQLLGDFKEGNFKTLNSSERDNTIELCLNCLKWLRHEKQKKILVTSDSQTFLNIVKNENDVYVIPGEFYHIDYSDNKKKDQDSELKSFIDFYMLANAMELYLVDIRPLYETSFPMTAALLNQRPLYEIYFDNDKGFYAIRTDKY